MENNHGYKIGDTVYVKPDDADVLKGVIIGFQAVGKLLPIVECNHPKKGEKFKNVFKLDSISKNQTITKYEWKIVQVKYKFKNGKA